MVSGLLHAQTVLLPGGDTVPIERGLSALQRRSGRFCRRETLPLGCTYVNINVLDCRTLRDMWLKIALAQSVLLTKFLY